MGINNLFSHLKKKHSKVLHEKYLFNVAFGHKILIDISSYIYKYKAIYKDKWLIAFIKFILFFKSINLHTTFIFDGKPPVLKDEERKRRFIQKEKLQDKAQNLFLDLEEYKTSGKKSQLLIDVMKKILLKKKDIKVNKLLHLAGSGKLKGENDNEMQLDIKLLEGRLVEIEGQIIDITEQDISTLKQIMTYLGIPYIQANCEAETLATYLCNNNKAKIVISEDSDVLAYLKENGISISKIDMNTGKCVVIYKKELLKEMKMTNLQFLDFCILSGTDYNENIYRQGIVSSEKYILKYKSIENFIKNVNSDIKKPLEFDRIKNYKEIRNIFLHKEIPTGRFYDKDKNDNKFLNNKDENKENNFHIINNIPIWDDTINLEKCFDYLESLNITLHKEIKNAWLEHKELEIKIEFKE